MNTEWKVLKRYAGNHLTRIALPVGGIGTGTVSLGGRGNLRDWEIMNKPAKKFTPVGSGRWCFPSIILSVAILRVSLENPTDAPLDASVCMNVPNYIGLKGVDRRNVNTWRQGEHVRGICMRAGNVDVHDEAWGTLALTTMATGGTSHRTAWNKDCHRAGNGGAARSNHRRRNGKRITCAT